MAVTFTPDVLGRTRQIDYPDYDGQAAHSVTYTYDEGASGKGRLTGMSDASGSSVWDYSRFDDQGILEKTTTINGFSYTTAKTVTRAGRKTQLVYPSGRVVDYQRSACVCAVSGVTTTYNNETATLLADIGLRPFALPQTMDIGNAGAPNIDNRYDLAGRLTAANPGTAYGRTYSHDANGNTTGISVDGIPLMNQQFSYDHLDRLDTAVGPFGAASFGYDALGNRTSLDENGLVDTFTYQQGTNRLSYIDRSDGGQTALSYDGRGNTTAIGDRVLTYNQDNRLARVDDGGFVAEYVYNGLGQRVIKTTAGATTYFHYDFGGRMIAETPGDGSVTLGKEYVYNGKVLLAHVEVETDQVYSFHTNYLGAVHQLTDASGTVVWEGIYKPFGEAVVNPGSTITNHWRLPGQYYDEETGLYYNYYRYYNPAIGRYLTPDPMGLVGGINRYAYVQNNPVNAIDPLGLADYILRISSKSLTPALNRGNNKVAGTIIIPVADKNGYYPAMDFEATLKGGSAGFPVGDTTDIIGLFKDSLRKPSFKSIEGEGYIITTWHVVVEDNRIVSGPVVMVLGNLHSQEFADNTECGFDISIGGMWYTDEIKLKGHEYSTNSSKVSGYIKSLGK